MVADRRREHEVAVGQALHQRAGAEAVGAVVGEVGLAEHVEAGHVAHQVVVDPEPTHRVVDGGVDAHGELVRVLVGDALVHLEEVAVALLDHVAAQTLDRAGEVEVGTVLQRADTPSGVHLVLDRPRRDVAGDEVAERRVPPLEEVVALALGDLVGRPGIVELLGTQTRPSLRSDSLISVSFDWKSSLAGMQVGWICVKHGLAISAPRLWARQIAVTLECFALVER